MQLLFEIKSAGGGVLLVLIHQTTECGYLILDII